jgi:hypothetical protein
MGVKTTRELRTSATRHDYRGWMSKNDLFLQQREKYFLLTSPFIEPSYCCGVSCQTVPWELPQRPVVP